MVKIKEHLAFIEKVLTYDNSVFTVSWNLKVFGKIQHKNFVLTHEIISENTIC